MLPSLTPYTTSPPPKLDFLCIYTSIVAHILNCSFSFGVVPSYWLRAIVTPVPKVSKPSTFPSDFRPISVTPILSRIAEKIVVRKWLRPVSYTHLTLPTNREV